MPGKPKNSSWGINVLEKTLHVWVSPRLLLMLPAQETVKLGDFRGRAEIMASVCVAAHVLKSGFIWGGNTSCAMSKGQPKCPDWTFPVIHKGFAFQKGELRHGAFPESLGANVKVGAEL